MTRLIDADKLPNIYTATHQEMIMSFEEAPTVDAIPVEWLKENYPTNGVYGTESYFRKAHAVEDILKDWEREKEKRKEE